MDNKKSLIALLLVALIGLVGATYAYFTSSAKLTNEFKTGTYSTSVTEEFVSPDNWVPGTTTTKKVNVTNNGTVSIVARATYTEKWTSKSGTELNEIRNNQRLALFNIGSNWEEATDGYYYYTDTLSSGETSSDFISAVTFNPNFVLEEGTDIKCTTTKENGKTTVNCENLTTGYAGAKYTLEITIETIQADQKWSYEKARHASGIYYDRVYYNSVIGDAFFLNRDNSISYRDYSSANEYEVPTEAIVWNANNGYVAAYDITFSWSELGDKIYIDTWETSTFKDYPLLLTEYTTIADFEDSMN